jgi:hypothetical protein
MAGISSFETSVTTCLNTGRHIPEDLSLRQQRCENLIWPTISVWRLQLLNDPAKNGRCRRRRLSLTTRSVKKLIIYYTSVGKEWQSCDPRNISRGRTKQSPSETGKYFSHKQRGTVTTNVKTKHYIYAPAERMYYFKCPHIFAKKNSI